MLASSAAYLWEAHRATERVLRFTAGRTFEIYVRDEVLRSAAERQIGIVGKALATLCRTDLALASTLSDLPRIVAFRNVPVHGYASVDGLLAWDIVERFVPGSLTSWRPC